MSVNPYQPPAIPHTQKNNADTIEADFYVTRWNLFEAESQFLIRKHPMRLLVVSISSILLALAMMLGAGMLSVILLAPAFLLGMAIATGMYLLSIHTTKQRIRAAQESYGLSAARRYMLVSDSKMTCLWMDATSLTWHNERVRLYTVAHGLLLQPQADLFVFVPKHGEFNTESFRAFRATLRDRLTGKEPFLDAIRGQLV